MKQRLGFAKKESDAPSPPDKKNEKEETFISEKSKRRRKTKQTEDDSDKDDEFTFGISEKGKRRPQTGKARGSKDPVDLAIITKKSERSNSRKRRSPSDDSEMGDGLKSKKSVKIIEPGFETGPIKQENNPVKPLKSALSRSRGRSRSSTRKEEKWVEEDDTK